MPNIANLLKAEIVRVARKTVRAELQTLKQSVGTYRTEVAALKKRNVPVEYVLFPDEGHGWRKQANRVRSTVEMTAFFVKHLK